MVLPMPMEHSPSFLAAQTGDLAALERLAAEGLLGPNDALAGAAKAGHVAALAWCAGRGAKRIDWAVAYAARGGHTEALAWCAENGATNFNEAMNWAARGGQTEALAWCAERGATDFTSAMIWAAEAGQTEALVWCAWAGHFARGDKAFTRAMGLTVQVKNYEAAELCLAWGGDINDSRFDNRDDRWVAAVRAGEIEVTPQDPGAYQSLGPFKFYD